ncbi:aldehyde dehydrogenase [Salipaludibacillus keqinensis]|uniref:Aldehyde dehydrogenase n=1 Tax=Salipaludibacillus keqinensis TaxID=2045207 RepID=A0A323THJ3_9BACI|nr:aldehyde dehydrogenase family protein [Salipaludibacillus keqinensis]PYZ93007.1 aldehyde dehydrogenase [Salipaludibacillus keqinensis]
MDRKKSDHTIHYHNLIGGSWVKSEQQFEVQHKFTNKTLAFVSRSSQDDITKAVQNALDTFNDRVLTATERYDILTKASSIFLERQEELAMTITCEVGKCIKDARLEVQRAAETFIASAEEAKRISGNGIPIEGQKAQEKKMAFSIRVPVGVIGAITPFNFPFNLTAHKVGPALAAGNAVVLKPAELTPISAIKMAEILMEAGLPGGYLNVVNGYGHEAGQYLLENEQISMYTFTGSPKVGRHIKTVTGIRKITLELGNNSPNIIHHDVPDLTKAAELCVTRGVMNSGQACVSVQRVYVHRDIYERFIEESTNVVKKMTYGDPELEITDVGCMISEKEAERAESWVKEAVDQGAVLVSGGSRDGAVMQPTVLKDVTQNMKVVCEEVFAPVVSIMPYDDIQVAFRLANDTPYGLQVGFFTSNLQLAMQAAKDLCFGGVIINDVSTFRADIMPYGGLKDSGIGKEGPKYAIHEMTDEKTIVINL